MHRHILLLLAWIMFLSVGVNAQVIIDDDFSTFSGWTYMPSNCPGFMLDSNGDLLIVTSYGTCAGDQFEGVEQVLPVQIPSHQDFEVSFRPVVLTDPSGEMGGVRVELLDDVGNVAAILQWFEPQTGTGYGGVSYYAEGNLIYGDESGFDTEYGTIDDTVTLRREGSTWSAWVGDTQKGASFSLTPTLDITKLTLSFYNFPGWSEREIGVDHVTLNAVPSVHIPFVLAGVCDSEYVEQPVSCFSAEPLSGVNIALELPEHVRDVSVIFDGYLTESWEFKDSFVKADSGFVVVYVAGGAIPEGENELFGLRFQTERQCLTNSIISWDTALSDDPSRVTHFVGTDFETFAPHVDPINNQGEILGFTPGDVNDDGGITLGDITRVIDYVYITGMSPCVMNAAHVNSDCVVNLGDIVAIIDAVYVSQQPLNCGCTGGSSKPGLEQWDNLAILSHYENSTTTISITTPMDLRGLNIELCGPAGVRPLSVIPESLDVVFGESKGYYSIGVLDLDGGNMVPAGQTPVIEIPGEFVVQSAYVVDESFKTVNVAVSTSATSPTLPEGFALYQNYPNPFNPSTQISFNLPEASDITLDVFNVLGQQVSTVADGFFEAGEHSATWDGSGFASGVYLYRLTTNQTTETRKMLLLK